MLEVYCSY